MISVVHGSSTLAVACSAVSSSLVASAKRFLGEGDVCSGGVGARDLAIVPQRDEELGRLLEDRAALVARYGGKPAERHAEQSVVAGEPRVMAGFPCASALAGQIAGKHSDSRRKRT